MKKISRRLLRKILKFLTKTVINKHNPTIIALVGKSGTAVPRKVLYHVLHEHFPTRRNLESPEAEFVIPLTIIGADYYPKSIFGWLKIVLKTLAQLAALPAHSNILILELNTKLSEILNYWLEITKPEIIITCGSHPSSPYLRKRTTLTAPSVKTTNLENYKQLALDVGTTLGLKETAIRKSFTSLELPKPRIRLLPGKKGTFVIDATFKFFPPLKQSIEEILNSLSGRKVWVHSQKEWQKKKIETGVVIVIFGQRNELLPVLEEACLNPLKS